MRSRVSKIQRKTPDSSLDNRGNWIFTVPTRVSPESGPMSALDGERQLSTDYTSGRSKDDWARQDHEVRRRILLFSRKDRTWQRVGRRALVVEAPRCW